MSLNWLAFHSSPRLELNLPIAGYLTLAVYALILAYGLFHQRASFRLHGRQWLLFAACLLAAPLLSQGLVVHFDSFPNLTAVTWAPFIAIPVSAAALWLGSGPAAVVGLVTGLTCALFTSGRAAQPFEIAIVGLILAMLLRQAYRGNIGRMLRKPLLTTPLAMDAIGWPLALIGILTGSHGSPLASLERTVSLMYPLLLVYSLSALVAGTVLQAVLTTHRQWSPVQPGTSIPAPWHRRLGNRLLYTFIPATTVTILLLVAVTAGTAYRVATGLAVDQMARDAATAGGHIPFFIQVGRSLVRNFAQDDRLQAGDEASRSDFLALSLRAIPFFRQLIYVDASGQIAAAYPAVPAPALSEDEISRVRLALDGGIPGEVAIFGEAPEDVSMSFIAAVSGADGEIAGALVGRTALRTNPMLEPTVDVLLEGFAGPGEGLLIDDQNRVLLYPAHPERQQQIFTMTNLTELPAGRNGQAFRQWQADGTRLLIYLLPVAGHSDWSVVITVPNEVALALAVQIALPTLVLMVFLAVVSLPMLALILEDVIVPLESLTRAATRIGEGNLAEPLQIDEGEDEIGRLGRVFEQMRIRLGQRLAEQEELLQITQAVASSPESYRAIQRIVSSALDMTMASGARISLIEDDDRPLRTFFAGPAGVAMAALDRQLLDLTQREGTTVISQLWRVSSALDTSNVQADIRALIALPLRSDHAFHGVLWLAFDREHVVEESEMTFLSTLAQQAAVAVENARLFAEAEEGRRKLEAVLRSTADGMIVVDNAGRVVLINPAAEAYFGVRADQAIGRRASEVIGLPELAQLLTNLQQPASVIELPGQNGQAFQASASTIVSHDGRITGRVAVLRDISALRELDNIKTVFLRLVSHDLRSPLTYMRGYLSMLPLEGPLTERQIESIARVRTGVDHIEMMTERLSYLSRLRFGEEVELNRTLVDIEALIYEILSKHERLAQQKQAKVEVEVEPDLPLLYVDDMLYGQAVGNLVHNALKYSPDGVCVTVKAYRDGDGRVAVAVSDTGTGIREEDQARLFEAFYRVPQREGEPDKPKGSGIGLALVKAIAEAHGGSVCVESTFGEGSTFTISVPLRHPSDE